ncbi:3-oxoadipyl-CoA thiolase [Psychrobacter lutiphocae]|uniref:3-oxoadipyl-CoA thiolase n=1 Tax=Psychrobacter lutiphocae TaxID=540500 RepID=UPI000364B266|nr:3-oxoadipyl-CoA thiolase [Psychrobacter lutiphocae]
MKDVYIVDYCRTPFGRYGGSLSSIRPDDLASMVLRHIREAHDFDPKLVDDCLFGAANQAGEDNRNVARMALLLAGYPVEVPGTTLNRLCGSGLDSIGLAARTIKSEEADIMLAGGVESMSRAPFVVAKPTTAFDRNAEMYDTTIGWRFTNKVLEKQYGSDSMPETAENVAKEYGISREAQDEFAYHSQMKAAKATERLAKEIIPVTYNDRKRGEVIVDKDEHPRPDTTLEKLARLKPIFPGGTVTAGNASGVNDGAAALLLASGDACQKNDLIPKVRVIATASRGVEPRLMGIGPIAAVEALFKRTNLTMDDFDIIELNEAFASQSLAVINYFGLKLTDPRLNPNGGAIALGHPLGASGARIAGSAMLDIAGKPGSKALITMCIGVGQGIAMAIEAV